MPPALTVITYNVHSCIGLDNRVAPSRIAEVISAYEPDIVALQELDRGLARTGLVEQARTIAEFLEMNYHFHPSFYLEHGQYGNAVLSRFPLRLVKAGKLPSLPRRKGMELRGAIWVEVMTPGGPVQVLNTHLGLNRKERLAQAGVLLGPEWLGHPGCRPPLLFCGDLNACSRSGVYKKFTRRMLDAQRLDGSAPGGTYHSRYPLMRLDYVFVSPDVGIESAAVQRDPASRVASDHLPLVVKLVIPGYEPNS